MSETSPAPTTQNRQTVDFYPARVVHGSEPIVEALQAISPTPLLTAEGCLVVPLVVPYDLRPVADGDPQPIRIMNCLERNGYDRSVPGKVGSAYLMRSLADAESFHARANFDADHNSMHYLFEEGDLINACIRRWRLQPRGLHPTIVTTGTRLINSVAHELAAALEKHKGTEVMLSEPRLVTLPDSQATTAYISDSSEALSA